MDKFVNDEPTVVSTLIIITVLYKMTRVESDSAQSLARSMFSGHKQIDDAASLVVAWRRFPS